MIVIQVNSDENEKEHTHSFAWNIVALGWDPFSQVDENQIKVYRKN
jgi:hypothetical protein